MGSTIRGLIRLLLALLVLALPVPARAEVGSERLSLPKGPGSIEGLASADFTPSLASGRAGYSIPIEVPPGARGFGPALALSYDSGAGLSEIAIGWRVSGVPSVRRRTQEGLPRFDETDTFEVVGLGYPSELIEVSTDVHRPRYEDGSFLRAERREDQWEVRTKAGSVLRFGGGPSHLVAEGGNIAAYLLEAAHDLRGHEVRYEWRTNGNFPLLERVVWNDFGPGTTNEVRFEYQARPDRHRILSQGIRQELVERLVRITVTHGGALVRRYELSYSEHAHPRLLAVTQVGADGVSSLPAVSFAYTEAALPEVGDVELVSMEGSPGWSPGAADTTLADLNGDGLPDLLVGQAGTYASVVNADGLSWETEHAWGSAQSPSFSLSSAGVQTADVDGDGALDLLISGGAGGARYLPGASETEFGSEVALAGELEVGFEDSNVRWADIDGDRRSDVVMTTVSGLVVVQNDRGVGFVEASSPRIIDEAQHVSFDDSGTDLCDINGDRVLDVCVLRPGALSYYLGRGRGVFEHAEQGTGVPEFEAHEPFVLKDLDGDGWDDLVRIGVTNVSYALAYAEGRFGSVHSIVDVPTKTTSTYATFADMNASGSVDLVWIDVSAPGQSSWRYLELFPDGRAGLLTEIDSGTGKRQAIEYASAASFAATARQSSRAWRSRLNLAMPVVARVTVDTGLGDPSIIREYEYEEGAYDPAERTFAGFGVATTISRGDAWTPTLVTQQRFDVGLVHPHLRGTVLEEEQRTEDGSVFSRRSYEYTHRELEAAPDGRRVQYGYRSRVRTEIIEAKPDASVVTLSELEQDAFGNVVAQYDWGVVSGDDYSAGHDETITLRTFANDAEEWILGHLASEELHGEDGARLAGTRRHYDGEAFVGLPLGQVTRGEVTREEAWLGPGNGDFELVLATRYDEHGVPVETKDARGGGRFFRWDESHAYVVSEGVKLDPSDDVDGTLLTERAEVDGRFGAVLQVETYAGATTRYEYDPFGRLTAVIRPGDSSALPTIRHHYEDGAPLSRVMTESRRESGAQAVEVREDLFDGLGRKRASFVLDAELWLLAGAKVYDARGEARLALLPRWLSEHERRSPSLAEGGDGHASWRDALGREVRTETPEGVVRRASYEPLRTVRWDGDGGVYASMPTVTVVDGRGRTIGHERTMDGELLSSSYVYDAAGRMTVRIDPEGHEQRFRFDGRGRRTEVDDPDQGVHRFGYDPAGNLLLHEGPGGVRTRSTYDLAGRLLTEDLDDDGQAEIVRTYDRGSLLNRGKLVEVTEPSGFVRHTYDERGLITQTIHRIEGEDYRVRSRFDAQGREVEHEYPDGSRIELERNARGLPSRYGDIVRIEYEARGSEVRRRYSTGVELLREHDGDGRPTELEFRSAAGRPVEKLSFHYDGRGDLTERFDERDGIGEKDDRSETYVYDDLRRLVGVSASWGSTGFRYSAAGNLLERWSTRSSEHLGQVDYGALPHAPTSVGERSIGYDGWGRMTSDGSRIYTWNGASQLTSVSFGLARVDNTYGQDGVRRVRRETNASGARSVTHFIDAWSEVKDGELVRYVVHAGERIVRLSNGPRSQEPTSASVDGRAIARTRLGTLDWRPMLGCFLVFLWATRMSFRAFGPGRLRTLVGSLALTVGLLLGCSRDQAAGEADRVQGLVAGDALLVTDHLGSLLATTSELGELRESLTLSPQGGHVRGQSTESHQFAQNPRDTSVQLDHMGARFYAPDLGLWTSPDPVGLVEPELQVTPEFAAAHPYAYANLRPTAAVDRDGHYWQALIGAGIGALAGGSVEVARQYFEHGTVRDWGRVGAAAAGGGVAGYLAAVAPAGVANAAAVGGLGNAAAGLATRLIESGGRSAGTLSQVGTDLAAGAIGGVVGFGAGRLLPSGSSAGSRVAAGADDAAGGGQSFFRGAKPGQPPNFTPRPNEFKVDPSTGSVRPTHGVSVFDNADSVSSKGFVPYEMDQATVPGVLQIRQRGADPTHFEIMPAEGTNLTPAQFAAACQSIACKP